MEPNQILVIGDCSFDVFLTPRISETLCKKQEDTSYICFTYGDKIPVDSVSYYPGGNAANIAIGLHRLGVHVQLSTYFSDDKLGELLKNHLSNEGIDLTQSITDPNSQCNYSTIITYRGERTIFTYHVPRTYTFTSTISPHPLIYLTSMGEGYESYYKNFISWASKQRDISICFNPGSVQLHGDKELLYLLFEHLSYLFINRDEAEYFTGINDSFGKEKELLNSPRFQHIQTVVITDSDNGSFIRHGDICYKAGCYPTVVKEKTGAGDAYNAGFLAGIIKQMNIQACIQLGTINAALVISSLGAQEGLLHAENIEKYLTSAKTLFSIEQLP